MPDTKPDVGTMRHRVTWKRLSKAVTPDSAGEEVETYTTIGTYWASIEPLRGMELFVANQQAAVRPLKIRMRDVGTVAAGDLLIFEGRPLTVQSSSRDMETNAYLNITVSEGPGAVPGSP